MGQLKLALLAPNTYHCAMFKNITTKATIISKRLRLIMQIGVCLIGSSMQSSCAFLKSNDIYSNFYGKPAFWQKMSDNFTIAIDPNQVQIAKQIKWLVDHKRYLLSRLNNSKPFIAYIYQQTQQRNMPAELALMPIIESRFNPLLISPVGATGLWQLMPGTASGFGLKINWWYDGRRDIIDSTKAALNYLNYLHQFFGNWLLAIAAYDCGEGTILNAVEYNVKRHRPTDFWSLRLPAETKDYVPQLLAVAYIIQHPKQYNINLPVITANDGFTSVEVRKQVSLQQISRLSNCKLQRIINLNPGFRRLLTPENKNNRILIPNKCIDTYKLNTQSRFNNGAWQQHRVQPGESLSIIAKKYHSSISAIEHANKLKSTIIRVGQSLLIPTAANYSKIRYNKPTLANFHSLNEDNSPGPKHISYTVVHGDSLDSIARKFGLRSSQIRFWNKSIHRLKPGEKLTLWLAPPHHSMQTHRVRSGETLSEIAHRYKTTIANIMHHNHMQNTTIKVGQKLLVPSI